MDDPVKIIFKYKNNNKKIQYHIYIYIGDLKSDEIFTILKKIKKKDLFDSLLLLSNKEQKIMVKEYGEYWYEKFFNSYHINYTKKSVKKNNIKKKQIFEKYGDAWYEFHFVERDLTQRKVTYNYESIIKSNRDRKDITKRRKIIQDEDIDVDYTTFKKQSINSSIILQQKTVPSEKKLDLIDTDTDTDTDTYTGLYNKLEYKRSIEDEKIYPDAIQELTNKSLKKLDPRGVTMGTIFNKNINYQLELTNDPKYGGAGDISNDENVDDEDDEEEHNDKQNIDEDEDEDEDEDDAEVKVLEEPNIQTGEDELELEDIEQMYKDVDILPDSNVSQTSKMIKKALNDEQLFDKLNNQLIEFNQSKDDLIYDEQLKNVYEKIYIESQYIFKDDTIKTIKHKICGSIKNNKKFGNNIFIIPSRQYLWSEYYYEDNVEKIMIGQKWVKKNEILNVDIEPNQNLRVYENLRGNLRYLKNNIKRYGSKIRREDDEYNILYDYDNYMVANELFMVDVYNELGTAYEKTSEELKNMSDVYFKIYFPKIKHDDIKHILDFLNNKNKKIESDHIKNIYDTINNDLVLVNEITKNVELIKKNNIDYKYIFKENYITQSVIHVILNDLNVQIDKSQKDDKMSLTVKKIKPYTKINLFRIFDNFIIDNEYPFIQYQTPDGNLNFKFSNKNLLENKGQHDILAKWFENSPYGISFKVKIKDKDTIKYLAINLHDNGRVEYKTQWKEEDMAKIEDIVNTYDYVKKLIRKINDENKKINIEIPNNDDFKFAFINTIQKFALPNKFIINHNDLSEFSRYFFPYVALVIEPRKRQSKIKKEIEKSKFGTYLRYKRVSKYENKTRIEHRVLYFMRNYQYNDNSLANEIAKQFNITGERAMEEIENVKTKYPNIKKSRKILKKLENIPKYKPPGIGIDIQGKHREKYKIRISGARNKKQLERIITFMNILIYLYTETYLYKKPERQKLKNKLKLLTNIAKRRNKVDEMVDYEAETKNIKQMTMLDKKRIGFKPEKGQNQWTRSCQNSGDDKKRRPQQYTNETLSDLIKNGYSLNNKTGQYEKKQIISGKGGKKKEIILRTIKLKDLDGTKNIYYGCNPEENGTHMHVGFLTRSNNPFGQCMPCCFKKDPMLSKNKEKKDYYLKCIGQAVEQEEAPSKILGDKLYILQDTNKIQEGRFGFLPKYLDIFINHMLNKERKIKNHYLVKSVTGYFFKYGTKQDDYQYLNCIATLFDQTIENIKNNIKKILKKDKKDIIFTSLNNGDLKTQFETSNAYLEFIENSKFIDYSIINDILCIPNTLYKHGLNIIIFQKKTHIIQTTLEKEKLKEDYIILCNNTENIDELYNPLKKNIIILKEDNNYYPIIMVTKEDDNTKNIKIDNTFLYQDNKNNIINHIMEYYKLNCSQAILNQMYLGNNLIAKHISKLLISLDVKEYIPKYQIIDARNKCIYLVTQNNTLVPVRPSGSLYNLDIQKSVYENLVTLSNLTKNLNKIYDLSKGIIKSKPIGVYVENNNTNKVKVIALITISQKSIPIKSEIYNKSVLIKMGYTIEEKSIDDEIDKEIMKGNENYIFDQRQKSVNIDKYLQESYQLFRLEISEFLKENESFKNKIDRIIKDNKITKKNKRNLIKSLVYKITNKQLYDIYQHINEQTGGSIDHFLDYITNKDHIHRSKIKLQSGGDQKLIHIADKKPNIEKYQINNNREICQINVTKKTCDVNPHCSWSNNQCKLSLTKDMLINFINKISEEIINKDLKKDEIFQYKNYFVSDIVDYNRFTERPNQKIIKSNTNNMKKMLIDIFGEENIPKIGKRRGYKGIDIDYQELNFQNPLKDMGDYYVQSIIDNNNTLFRAFANCLFWKKNKLFDDSHRNLGYYSSLQTDLSNYFKSLIIDWLVDKNNKQEIKNNLFKYIDDLKRKHFIQDFVVKISNDINTFTNCIIETYILAKEYKQIIYVYDENNKLIYIFDNILVYDTTFNKTYDKKYDNIEVKKKSLHLRFNFLSRNINPDKIEALYIKDKDITKQKRQPGIIMGPSIHKIIL